MQHGELIIMGTDTAQFALNGVPIKISVEFSDEGEIIVPCNPHFHDTLTWSIHNNILIVRWQVNGIREIKWKAWFYWNDVP
jgi:hypothetical protein